MAKPNLSFVLTDEVQEKILQYYKSLANGAAGAKLEDLRAKYEAIDRQYLREVEVSKERTKALSAAARGDITKYENIIIPVIKPKVEAQVGYQSAVFLSDWPIFGISSPPEFSKAGKQMQAIIEENSVRTGWARQFLLFFHDGARYNKSYLECSWDTRTVPAVETDLNYSLTEGKPSVEVEWAGNVIKRLNPYNTIVDSRVSAEDFPSEGEFAINTRPINAVGLKQLIQSLPDKIFKNINLALSSPSYGLVSNDGQARTGVNYYVPDLRRTNAVDGKFEEEDWAKWLELVPDKAKSMGLKGAYELTKMYLRIIPSHFGLNVPSKNTPQVWCFHIVNQCVIVAGSRLTNAHNKIPVFIGEPAEDGLDHNTKSLAEDVAPFQRVTTALMSSVINAKRRAIFDRLAYDPSRINESDINSPNPAARIRIKPNAYGRPISDALMQIPFRDDQSHMGMQEIQGLLSLSDQLVGLNPARQGQFVPGNKTDGQWNAVMSNSSSRDQRTAWIYEAGVMTPLKEVLKLNILQYQSSGTVYSPSSQEGVEIDPVELRKSTLFFKVTDGLLPKEKLMSTETRKVLMQVLGSSPQLSGAYNLGPMFSYIAREENADLSSFEKSPQQLAYEQAVNSWMQLAQLAIQKQAPFTVPQPLPEQFGYDPKMQDPNNRMNGGPANSTAQQ